MDALIKNLLFAVFFLSCLHLVGQIPQNGLIVHYDFQGNVNDASVNNLDGINNGATFVTDRYGNSSSAISFDGTNDYVITPNNSLLRPDFPFTVSFWVNLTNLTLAGNEWFTIEDSLGSYSGYFSAAGGAGIGQVAGAYGDGTGGIGPNARISKVSDSLLTTTSWHQIAIVYNSHLDVDVYIDCEDAGGSYTGNGDSLVYFEIAGALGRRPCESAPGVYTHCYFNGDMDDFAVWNRALSSTELEALCDTPSVPTVIVDNELINSIQMFPNPTDGILTIDFGKPVDKNYNLMVRTMTGKIVYEEFNLQNQMHSMNLDNLREGMYIIELRNDDQVILEKIMISD